MICKVLFGKKHRKNRTLEARSLSSAAAACTPRGEKFWSGLCPPPAEEFFIPLKFSGRAPLGEQENLHPGKSDPSLFSEAPALPVRCVLRIWGIETAFPA